MTKKLILVTNDDGIHASGLKRLAEVAGELGRVFVVAPDRERSAASHSLTLHRPLRVTKTARDEYTVDGTPTDCVTLAVNSILPRTPDIVLSGINMGTNLGEDVLYSGTVSAAMEGTMLGIPSVALSMSAPFETVLEYAGLFAARVASQVLAEGLPPDTLLNINVPGVKKIKGHRITNLGKRFYNDVVIEKIDPRGKKYYWIGGDIDRWEGGEDSDFRAFKAGYVSVTPLHFDMTNYDSMRELKGWEFD
ncbi:MAG: 5'/3'-nucleotidase SurE [Thermodesulfobacteriota bacterium]